MTSLPHVLVVEHDDAFAALLDARIRSLGGSDVVVGCVDDAVRALEREQFDLVVSDRRLGSGDGLDVVAYASRRFPGLSVVLADDGDDVEARRIAFALRADVVDRRFLLGALAPLVRESAAAAA